MRGAALVRGAWGWGLRGLFAVGLVGVCVLVARAAMVARGVRPGEAESRRIAAALEPAMAAPAVAAEVLVASGVRLSDEDVSVWQRLMAQGVEKDEALRIVLLYRRAAGGVR